METIDEIRRKNLKILVKMHSSLSSFAEVVDKSSSQVSQWVNGSKDSKTGKRRGFNDDTARYIENKIGKQKGWLDQDHDIESNAEPAPTLGKQKKIAVVGTAQLGDDGFWAELEYPAGHGDGYVQHASKDVTAYALRCKGDSMKPRIKNGEYVIIEPSHTPVNGDEVMVKCKKGRVMVKELLYIRDDVVHLGSVNEAHAKITIGIKDVESIQYVAAIVKSSYWSHD